MKPATDFLEKQSTYEKKKDLWKIPGKKNELATYVPKRFEESKIEKSEAIY